MLNKVDGAQTTTIEVRQQRWTEWISHCLQNTTDRETPKIMHIREQTCHELHEHTPDNCARHQIPGQLNILRRNPPLQQLFEEHPNVEVWITQPYGMREIQSTILKLQNNKDARTDGREGGYIKYSANTLPNLTSTSRTALCRAKKYLATGPKAHLHIRKKIVSKNAQTIGPSVSLQSYTKYGPRYKPKD